MSRELLFKNCSDPLLIIFFLFVLFIISLLFFFVFLFIVSAYLLALTVFSDDRSVFLFRCCSAVRLLTCPIIALPVVISIFQIRANVRGVLVLIRGQRAPRQESRFLLKFFLRFLVVLHRSANLNEFVSSLSHREGPQLTQLFAFERPGMMLVLALRTNNKEKTGK
jgi:hypothetical protein